MVAVGADVPDDCDRLVCRGSPDLPIGVGNCPGSLAFCKRRRGSGAGKGVGTQRRLPSQHRPRQAEFQYELLDRPGFLSDRRHPCHVEASSEPRPAGFQMDRHQGAIHGGR